MSLSIPIEFLQKLVSNLRDPDQFVPQLSTYLPPGSDPGILAPSSTRPSRELLHLDANGASLDDGALNVNPGNFSSGEHNKQD